MSDEPTKEAILRLAIVRREAQLEADLKGLVHVAERRATFGYYVGRYPYHFAFGGLVLGLWLGRRR